MIARPRIGALIRAIPFLVLMGLAACAGNEKSSSPSSVNSLASNSAPFAGYPAMGKFTNSPQLLVGEARGYSSGLIFIALSSEPQIVDAFFDNWDGKSEFDLEAFLDDLARRDLMLLDLQACFMGLVRNDYDDQFEAFVPDNLRGETVFLGSATCIEGHEDLGVMMVLDRDGIVKGMAATDDEDFYMSLMFNGSREAFTRWSQKLQEEEIGTREGGSSSSQGADEPDV